MADGSMVFNLFYSSTLDRNVKLDYIYFILLL